MKVYAKITVTICYIEMPNKESILKYNHGKNSMKIPFIIYANMEPLLKE